jgi:catechol 2,3-dioxygenase-like lactoylglutathione lyase family enzyme
MGPRFRGNERLSSLIRIVIQDALTPVSLRPRLFYGSHPPSMKGPSMAKFTYDHIHLRSPDPEATAKWYEQMLGAEVLRTTQQGKPRIDLKLGGADVFIAPVGASDGVNPAPTTPYLGLDHFGLSVTGIDAIAADLKAKGVTFTKEPTTIRPGVRICFIEAPQGVSIELLDRTV